MTIFSDNRDANTTIRNVNSVRDITKCFQIDIFDGFICNITQGSIKGDYYGNTVLAEDATSYDTTVTGNSSIARYCQIDKTIDVIYSTLALK